MLANVATKAFFGADLMPWALEGWDGNKTKATDSSWELSLSELVYGAIPGGQGHGFYAPGGWTVTKAIKNNLKAGGADAVVKLAAIPIGFRLAKSLTKKPRASMNKLLRSFGINEVKV